MNMKYTFEICMLNRDDGLWEPKRVQSSDILPRAKDGILIEGAAYTVRNVVHDFTQATDGSAIKLYVVPGI